MKIQVLKSTRSRIVFTLLLLSLSVITDYPSWAAELGDGMQEIECKRIPGQEALDAAGRE